MNEEPIERQLSPNILVERTSNVGVIRFNRPRVLNAFSRAMTLEVLAAVQAFDADRAVGAILLLGSNRAFSAGADLRELPIGDASAADRPATHSWAPLERLRKPLIAGVSGYALGAGFEVAMMCDVVIAGESAEFGLPEVEHGIIPGSGGTQRLARCVGKAKAMEMIMTGERLGAREAAAFGLVSRVVPNEEVVERALDIAARIASKPIHALMAAKASVNAAFETSLSQGVRFERRQLDALLLAKHAH